MKVLQILPSLDVGGVERGVVDLVRVLKEQGVDSVVVSSGGALVSELQKMTVPHYELPIHQKSLATLSQVSKLVEIIRKEGVNIIHARSRVPAWVAWFAARKAGIPFVTTCHGYYSSHPLSRVMGWGKRVIVISRVIGRHMIDDFDVSPERIRLIYRGVDTSQFYLTQKSKQPAAFRKIKRIINVGRLSPIKGQVEFLKAIHILKSQMPEIEVLLVGSENKGRHKYTDLIQKTITQLNLGENVKLLGTRRDIPELLVSSDLLVLSTLVPEAFGRVIVEAGAMGVPVLATKVGGVVEVIDEGENGWLVSAGDIQGMAKKMLEILKQEDRALVTAQKLQEKVLRQFTLEKMCRETLAVYQEVIAEKKILLIKLGAMGDVILSIPSLRMLRERFPQASITVLVDKKLASVLAAVPYINDIIPIDRKKLSNIFYLLRLAKKMRREGFDISVDLQNSKWTHLLASLSCVGERYGFQRGQFGFLLNRPDRTGGVAEPPVKNQFRILSKLGIRQYSDTLELWSDKESEIKIENLIHEDKDAQPVRPIIGMVIGSSRHWPTKRWPIQYFQELAGRLISEMNGRVILVGGVEDQDILKNLSTAWPDGVLNLIGKTSIQELIALIKSMDVLVTGDTAPLHVASAVKTKIVALFGPTDSKRHMPPAFNAVVLERNLSCQPCYKGTCRNPEKLACLNKISVQEVFESVKRHLSSFSKSSFAKV